MSLTSMSFISYFKSSSNESYAAVIASIKGTSSLESSIETSWSSI